MYLLSAPEKQPQLSQAELVAIRQMLAEHAATRTRLQQITTGCPVARMLTK